MKFKLITKIIYSVLVSILLSSCATPIYQSTSDINLSVGTITKVVISSLPGGLREKSQNGRELASNYFSLKLDDPHFDPDKSPQRVYVKAIVLGDRRPFTVDVGVFIEEKIGPRDYKLIKYDKKLANKYLKIIKDKLAQSREDRNVIDDFRPF